MRGFVAGLIGLVASALPLGAQTVAEPIMLNRSGRWAEAATLAETMLRGNAGSLSLAERCEVRYSLAYAYLRTRRAELAAAEAEGILTDCASLSQSYVLAETRKLVAEVPVPSGQALSPRQTPAQSDDGWESANPEALNLNAAALQEHEQLCRSSAAAACLVAVRGSIVQEWYGPGYSEPMTTMSSVKSWTALLAGLLIDEGRLELDDPVSKWIPEWQAGSRGGVTVRHLLTMTSGLRNRTEDGVGAVGDKNSFVFGLPLDAPPGTRWAYSNEGVQLLSPILERAAGRPLDEFARDRLFAPLRMDHTRLRLDQAGSPWTYADAETTLRDFAKICELVLGNGSWLRREVIPASWIETILTPGALSPDPRYGVDAYGMLWWLNRTPLTFMTKGYLDTDCYAFPEYGVVVARMQRVPGPAAAAPYARSRVENIVRRLVGAN